MAAHRTLNPWILVRLRAPQPSLMKKEVKKLLPKWKEFCLVVSVWMLPNFLCIKIHHALDEERVILAKSDKGVRCILVKEALMLFSRSFQLCAEAG